MEKSINIYLRNYQTDETHSILEWSLVVINKVCIVYFYVNRISKKNAPPQDKILTWDNMGEYIFSHTTGLIEPCYTYVNDYSIVLKRILYTLVDLLSLQRKV